MAFDYGSIDLGLKNPFKKEGLVTAIRGGIVSIIGIYLLISAAQLVQNEPINGWILVAFGLLLLGGGISTASSGIIAMLRYFVGRNHPTSLAQNKSRSESSTAQEETPYVAYNKQELTEMLMGRKNSTFVEPQGFLARFVHSIFPRLTYMPYPVRNMAQRLFGAWAKTLVALISYGLVAFVSLAGFAGEVGSYIFPIYSILLTLYLLLTWHAVGASINRMADKKIASIDNMELIRVVLGAILLPVLIGLGFQYLLNSTNTSLATIDRYVAYLPEPHTIFYLLSLLVGAALISSLIAVMLRKRLNHADPKVEVSELRENWQESVHPNEIFINLDNLVMANRRYKEVPNRVYQELIPKLKEQVEGKGSFFGEMIQEIQPKFTEMNLGKTFEKSRLISLISGNIFFLVSAIFTLLLAFTASDVYSYFSSHTGNPFSEANLQETTGYFSSISHLVLVGFLFRAFGRILSNAAHLFFAEMQFESHLIYLKIEGTFTESKISTGASIHDSTRSENTLVRSSITPWIIACRVVSSTFASTGMRNLEYPRFILEMHKSDDELSGIRSDVMRFLKDRESIAAITSERDLTNASQIHEINQKSRAIPVTPDAAALLKADEEAGGYIQQAEEQKKIDDSE
ncbi:MAG: hypothetical protein ACPG46_01525 [Thalassotalea sp.]